ncbi:Alpha/Beta hydrolase protein [Gigaspora rosea]|uniref:Alpha/Beta hydrolase protein n=1 Tax=Gigaspora rosea TaxID=44941 RepID=A0A397WDU6_9GLOM|nr:Alpha/Beta hydrolase protein [Gigaspora rosea]
MPKNLDNKVIRNKLSKTMEQFKIPDIIPVDNLPCTVNGKTDHAKVKNIMPELLKKVTESDVPRPQNKNSKDSLISYLQAVWQDILALKEKPDINTSFFDLGGHSFLLLQLQKKIQQISSVELVYLFRNPTIESLANFLMQNVDDSISVSNMPPSMTKLNHGCETVKPIYMIPTVDGTCAFYKDIISSLANVTIYGFEYPGFKDPQAIKYYSIEELSEFYLKDLLKNNQSDMYNLFSSSFTGLVAYEMGCKLVKQGKSVNLFMVDTVIGEDMQNMPSLAAYLHNLYPQYNLDELSGVDDEDELMQKFIEKILHMKETRVIRHRDTLTSAIAKRYFEVLKSCLKAMELYQLPRSENPMSIVYFKAKIRNKLDPEFPEKSWIKIQEINGGKFDYIELDDDHINVNRYPTCKIITDYIKQIL